ncbi:MAG: hypothetical protein DMD81_10230 [Candidatus Rokuibacteriota bacterium]|nr:MAG: hypothetical protein DMD81_10230 [Candidatus Rokubacteria bacterium]
MDVETVTALLSIAAAVGDGAFAERLLVRELSAGARGMVERTRDGRDRVVRVPCRGHRDRHADVVASRARGPVRGASR